MAFPAPIGSSSTRKLVAGFLMLALTAPMAQSQSPNTEHTLKLDEGTARPEAKIDRLAWMAGAWEGEAFGGRFEEVWSAPTVGTMIGTFKLVHGDQASMYEFQVIVEDGDSLALRLKHFNTDLTGWESKDGYVDFPLVKLTEDTAFFTGLTYRRVGPDEIEVFLAIEENGEIREERLGYRRIK